MADPREVFPILQNPSTKEGEAADRVQQGEAVASKNGIMGWAFKDQSGNAVAPTLTSEGKVPVDFEGAGTKMRAKGELAAGSATIADVTGASIALTADKVYSSISMLVSCRRAALFQLIQTDDAVETVLAEVVLDAGQYTFQYVNPYEEITAGSTGTQTLSVKAKNLDSGSAALSSLRATITTVELPAGV